jgi:molybdopterin-guanine dinucleotide biosynthesis protein
MHPFIVVIAGLASNVGKTTLVCGLLERLEGWEAIKVSRGHYRSCGRDPQACCIGGMLGPQPRVLSGREETYTAGKDTGRYWDAGASNVHWVIATDAQVEAGLERALSRVKARGVIIEGTSVLKYIDPALAILVTRSSGGQLKPSARVALRNGSIDAIYLSGPEPERAHHFEGLPHYTEKNLDLIATGIFNLRPGAITSAIRRER